MIGDREWMTLTQGKLNFKDKITLMKTVMLPATLSFVQSKFSRSVLQSDLTLSNIHIPDTAIVKEAISELEQTKSREIIQHSWRCFFWGVAIAHAKQWQFDDENFLIASLMHDVGLVDHQVEYQSCQCFTFESALRSEHLCQRHDYPEYKTHQISDAICLHMNGYLDENDQKIAKEVLLLQQATAYDVIGTQPHLIAQSYYSEILAHYPKDHFKTRFQDLIKQETQQHPHSRTALLSTLGLKLMLQLNRK
ncbi:hypothetical protein [Acinetobacter sp. Marseille-Q1618]|uniref:hypothetical protein n=1 Tax=Acinetobacter sp. Marseille-Q1618 TaxID=2697502 RepID=UPI00156E807A|nr:hypothetical protein [Acinetobacter sp. Marseille-Q1618]